MIVRSYQVPKEVGKIGAESPSFIQPIAERKDGIEAMFAKQASKAAAATSSQATPQATPTSSQVKPEPRAPVKRKRDDSVSGTPRKHAKTARVKKEDQDVIDLCEDSDSPKTVKSGAREDSESKAEKINSWEDGAVEYTDEDNTTSSPRSELQSTVSPLGITFGCRWPELTLLLRLRASCPGRMSVLLPSIVI